MGSWSRTHADELKATTVGVVVLALAVGGLLYFRSNRAASANLAFGEAMEAFEAIAPMAAEETAPGAQTVAREEKLKKALIAFDGVANRFKSLPVGVRARYFAGACRVELGELDAAEQNLREVASRKVSASGPVEPALARLALAGVSRRKGALDAAVNGYRELLADASAALPKDYVLIALAGTLEQSGRLAEAATTFRRVVDEYPQSPFAGDARARAEYLKTAATSS